MTRIWRWNRPVTVREVLEDLEAERTIAYTTVMTVLDNLHQKGWVRRHQEGRAYRYEPISTRAAYSAALMKEAWGASDNPAAALVDFFGMMSPEQIGVLRDALRVVQLNGVRVEEPRENTDTTRNVENPRPPAAPEPETDTGTPASGTGGSGTVGEDAGSSSADSPDATRPPPPASGSDGSRR